MNRCQRSRRMPPGVRSANHVQRACRAARVGCASASASASHIPKRIVRPRRAASSAACGNGGSLSLSAMTVRGVFCRRDRLLLLLHTTRTYSRRPPGRRRQMASRLRLSRIAWRLRQVGEQQLLRSLWLLPTAFQRWPIEYRCVYRVPICKLIDCDC